MLFVFLFQMERQIIDDDEHSCHSSYREDMLALANNQVDEAISNALNSLTRILSLPCISLQTTPNSSPSSSSYRTPTNSLQPTISIRCRSSSRNNRRERKIPFHNTIPRCSLPATNNDLVQYQSHLLSFQLTNQTRCRSSQNVNGHSSHRTCDVQYSFSLNKPWLTKINKQRHNLISIQNFVNELIEHSIRAALIQVHFSIESRLRTIVDLFSLDRLSKYG